MGLIVSLGIIDDVTIGLSVETCAPLTGDSGFGELKRSFWPLFVSQVSQNDVGDKLQMLMTKFLALNLSPIPQSYHQLISSPRSVTDCKQSFNINEHVNNEKKSN